MLGVGGVLGVGGGGGGGGGVGGGGGGCCLGLSIPWVFSLERTILAIVPVKITIKPGIER